MRKKQKEFLICVRDEIVKDLRITRGKLMLSSILLVSFVYTITPRIFIVEPNTARYLLNTIISSLVMTLSISISVIFFTVQLTSTKWTHKVLDLWINFNWNYILLVFFFTAIVHSTIILALISEGLYTSKWVVKGINFDILMFGICLILLVVYIFRVLKLLKPSNILKNLYRELNYYIKNNLIDDAIKQLDIIYDITKKATSDFDIATSIEGLKLVSETFLDDKLYNNKFNTFFEQAISHLQTNFSIAVKSKDRDSIKLIIETFELLGYKFIESKYYEGLRIIIDAIEHILIDDLIGRPNIEYIKYALNSLNNLNNMLLSNNHEHAYKKIIKISEMFSMLTDQIIENQPNGYAFVAEFLLNKCFGAMLEKLVDEGKDIALNAIIGYYYYALKSFFSNANTEDVVKFSILFRRVLVDDYKINTEEYLKIYFVILSLCYYLKKYNAFILLLKSVAKFYSLNPNFLKMLNNEINFYKIYFDFNSPDKYFNRVYFIWNGYAKIKHMKRQLVNPLYTNKNGFMIDQFSEKRLFNEGKLRIRKVKVVLRRK